MPAAAVLRLSEHDTLVSSADASPDANRAAAEVNVTPPKCQQLPLPHSRRKCQHVLLTKKIAINQQEHVLWFVTEERTPVRWGDFSAFAQGCSSPPSTSASHERRCLQERRS